MAPSESRQYVVSHANEMASKDFSALTLETKPIPSVGENDVLIRIHAVSLNWRDVMVTTNTYLWPIKGPIVPCSDGAGEVISTGGSVTRFKAGDRVAAIFHNTHISGDLKAEHMKSGLGAQWDGMLREYAVFNEQGLVAIPQHMSYEEASCLPCAALTAWNALMGSERKMRFGDCVVTQGTGGVSMFAAQFALAAGAKVISTTSSAEKAEYLKKLGVHEVVNYRETPDWGVKAKFLSPNGEGADFVIEIGGVETFEQSLQAVKISGHIEVIGQRTAQDLKSDGGKDVSLMQAFKHICTIRRIIVGNRQQFEEMNHAMSVNKIKPVIDKELFSFDEAKEAFQYLADGRHVGNVVIKVV